MARPSFKPTAAQRRSVTVGAAGGLSHEELSMAIGISRPTLEKHFEVELSTGAYKRRLAWLEAMDKAARSGNVSAQKALMATVPILGTTPIAKPAEAAPDQKLGKKEQAAKEATTAAEGTTWGELLPRPGSRLQ